MQITPTAPGLYPAMPNAAYHASDGISNSQLDEIAGKSQLHFWDKYFNPDRPAEDRTEAMILGDAIHTAILESDTLTQRVITVPRDTPIRCRATDAARASQARETIQTMKADPEALTGDEQRQTKTITALQSYKFDLLGALPIDGLEVRDGEIYRHGVRFDRLNTAQQVKIAVELAKLRAGELGVVCVDGLELLNPANFKEFKAQSIESGLQLFIIRATDGAFSINTEN